MENSSVVDVIGVVSAMCPSRSIMRKNGNKIQKRMLQLKDTAGRSVESTLWGSFCHAEGQTLQNMWNSVVFPVLAVKSGRVNDFNGKTVGTISTSQLFIEPDFCEAHKLKGNNEPGLDGGTSEKPDWIKVSTTLSFIKVDNFRYTAPIVNGDRQCNKKLVDECDYRYIIQLPNSGSHWLNMGDCISVKAEKVSLQNETMYLLDSITKFKGEDSGFLPLKSENVGSTSGMSSSGFGTGYREPTASAMNYSGNTSNLARETAVSANQYGGSTLHLAQLAYIRVVTAVLVWVIVPDKLYGSSFGYREIRGASAGAYGSSNLTPAASAGGECFNCHQIGHWAKHCPGLSNGPPAYGSCNSTPRRYGNVPKQHVGGL
ncbi:replication A 70 kDa DNA-binding subunit A-like [Olea europaea subsp. europaea]|uniref:Replication A 70 kDa DNA-binding subunit A-like n=1 Tax=Olea europaea subsp. europaea TaxID=158383 RepID=A0A8S0PLM1_OLEEU|nr:replication A 70 kDa DNA-binding subunit A-like [Olea europaea subsp. europaea]